MKHLINFLSNFFLPYHKYIFLSHLPNSLSLHSLQIWSYFRLIPQYQMPSPGSDNNAHRVLTARGRQQTTTTFGAAQQLRRARGCA
jgi:hypothetical protein